VERRLVLSVFGNEAAKIQRKSEGKIDRVQKYNKTLRIRNRGNQNMK